MVARGTPGTAGTQRGSTSRARPSLWQQNRVVKPMMKHRPFQQPASPSERLAGQQSWQQAKSIQRMPAAQLPCRAATQARLGA